MLAKTAIKNILGVGKRTWLNVAVLSFTLVITVAYHGIQHGWIADAKRNTVLWEVGAGQFWHPQYDRYDIFTLQDAHGPIPPSLQAEVASGAAEPVLVIQGSLHPAGRMLNVLIKGLDPQQQILSLPMSSLANNDSGELQAMLGSRMAKSAGLQQGDRVTLRWRDRNGAFDAREIVIAAIFYGDAGSADSGNVWMPLDQLYEMTGMQGEATYLVTALPHQETANGWPFHDAAWLMRDLDSMQQASQIEVTIVFSILLAIAMLAVFDTQTLAVFRRQKEIGTYVALGMTPGQVSLLFTLEGMFYCLLGIAAALVWGTPLLYVFQKIGMALPDSYGDMGFAIGSVLYPDYDPATVLLIILVLLLASALVSWLPTRKIARQNMVLALKGKAI